MERSENINELATALSKAQGEIRPAIKDSNNPFFKSKYADLASVWEVCREPLAKNGLCVSQHPTAEGNTVTIETLVTHNSGQWMSSKLSMTSKEATPQGIGSAITYARRYALSSIVGIASEEDDDGNAATHKNGHEEKTFNRIPPTAHVASKVTDPAQIELKTPTLLEAITKMAKEKFESPDEFKTWRVDNGLPENLTELKDQSMEMAKVWTAVREYKAVAK